MRYESTTGMTPEQISELTGRVWEVLVGRRVNEARLVLDFSQQVQLTLMVLRHTMPQTMAAEFFGVSQATVSRVWHRSHR